MKLKRFLKLCAITVTATLIIIIPFLWGFLPKYYIITDAEGESMQPTLDYKGVRLFRVTKDVQEWDIILYQDGENLVCHRLVYIDHDRGLYYPMGDNNKHGDNPITKDEILGKLVFSYSWWKFNTFFISIIVGSFVGIVIITRKILRGENYEKRSRNI